MSDIISFFRSSYSFKGIRIRGPGPHQPLPEEPDCKPLTEEPSHCLFVAYGPTQICVNISI